MPYWPRTGCSVIVRSGGRVLMVKRGKEPFRNHWSLPGGSQEAGESLEDCARRELLEETSLEAKTLKFAAVRDRIAHSDDGSLTHHFVLVTFLAETFEGSAVAGDDALEIDWYTPGEMEQLETTPDTVRFVQAVLAGAS